MLRSHSLTVFRRVARIRATRFDLAQGFRRELVRSMIDSQSVQDSDMAAINPASLAGLPAFAGLDSTQLADLLREARSTHHPKGSHVFEQGADADRFFV